MFFRELYNIDKGGALRVWKYLFLSLLLINTFTALGSTGDTDAKDLKFYQQVFPSIDRLIPVNVPDPISEEPLNTTILKAFSKNILIGFMLMIYSR